jgi:hypothetical protein
MRTDTAQRNAGVKYRIIAYGNALAHELRKAGLAVAQQHGITAKYDSVIVGEYAVDLWSKTQLSLS